MEFFHWVRSSPHLAIVPIEGALLFELVTGLKFYKDFFEYSKYSFAKVAIATEFLLATSEI
jgi:hypothetical protein